MHTGALRLTNNDKGKKLGQGARKIRVECWAVEWPCLGSRKYKIGILETGWLGQLCINGQTGRAQWDRHKYLYFTIFYVSQLLRTRPIIPLSLLSQITLTSWVVGLTIMPPKRSVDSGRDIKMSTQWLIPTQPWLVVITGYSLSSLSPYSPEILLWCLGSLSPSSKSPHWSHLALLWQVTSGWPPGTQQIFRGGHIVIHEQNLNIQDYQFQSHNNSSDTVLLLD